MNKWVTLVFTMLWLIICYCYYDAHKSQLEINRLLMLEDTYSQEISLRLERRIITLESPYSEFNGTFKEWRKQFEKVDDLLAKVIKNRKNIESIEEVGNE